MRKSQYIFVFFLVFFTWNSHAQLDVYHHYIKNNDTTVNIITSSKTSKSIIFFCPTVYISQESFFKKAEELIKSSKIKGITDLTIHFVYFKQDVKSNAKGLKYASKDNTDTLFIGQFECFFVGFNTNYLQRAKTKMKFNYDIEQVFQNENLFSVPIVDTNKCFEKIPDRIPFYADFLKESIFPNYSTDEKIQFLRDTVNSLYSEIEILKKEIQKITKGEVIIQNEKPIENNNEVEIKTDIIPIEKQNEPGSKKRH